MVDNGSCNGNWGFVDCDMFVRHLGCGVGSLKLQAHVVERIMREGFDPDLLFFDTNVGANPDCAESDEDSDVDSHVDPLGVLVQHEGDDISPSL